MSKRADEQLEEGTPLADRTNMVYKGTTAAAGTALAVVTGTGASTEIGRIGTLVGAIEEGRTPLERRLDELGRRLVWLALGIAALVAALGAWQGAPLGLVLEMGIALAVAAVPEALPAVATIALAVGVHRMARRHALVRRLPAVEALGSATVVCTDKTRTLTSGLMTLVRMWTAGRDVALRDEPTSRDRRLIVRRSKSRRSPAGRSLAAEGTRAGAWRSCRPRAVDCRRERRHRPSGARRRAAAGGDRALLERSQVHGVVSSRRERAWWRMRRARLAGSSR